MVAKMVSGERCCGACGALCRRLFCRAKPVEEDMHDETIPVTTTQLSDARDVKFTQTISEPLSIGSHIVCTGTPSEDLPWFSVNIGVGDPEGRGDIAVHFNVRLPQCYVVRNTRRHDKWGVEETTSFRLFPFKMERPFTIEVLVEEKETLWAVDGEHYCRYPHRLPNPLLAAWVQVTGVRNATLNINKTDIYPALAPPPTEVPLLPSIDALEETIDTLSWGPNTIASLSNGIPEGYQLVIVGRLRPMLHSFAIELTDSAREWPYPNVHLHANVRAYVDSHQDRQLVVLNAWFGAWGPERRQRTARLIPGSEVTFRIVLGAGEWQVYSGAHMIGELERRAAAKGVRGLRLRGDLRVRRLYLCPVAASPHPESCC